LSGQLHPEIVCHHDGYTCGVRYNDDTVCRGAVTREVAGDWVYFRCEKCGVERAGHVNRFDRRGQRQASLERAGLPPAFFNKTFDGTPDNREARRIVREWLAQLGTGMLPAPALYGLNGRGKSHLLTAICERLINEHDKNVLFRSSRQLMRELTDFENRDRLWERLVSVDVLALDDVGAEQDTEWRFDQLADLLDEREQRELPVLVTTNFRPEAWSRRFGERTASRLRGMTLAVELGGSDRRQERMEVAA